MLLRVASTEVCETAFISQSYFISTFLSCVSQSAMFLVGSSQDIIVRSFESVAPSGMDASIGRAVSRVI